MTVSPPTPSENEGSLRLIERIGKAIPDPVVLFASFLTIALFLSWSLGGLEFFTTSAGGDSVRHTIKNMMATEHIRWMFDNAILANWLSFGHGVLGIILIVMLGVGIAEHSGLLSAVIRKLGHQVPHHFLAPFLVFLGIMSSIATDAGYLILIPLAGMVYSLQNKNPLVGMAAAFAGVSAGFSANLIPATPVDVVIGANAKVFAEIQGIPFTDSNGKILSPATMHYFFIFASTIFLTILGGWVTTRFVEPRVARMHIVSQTSDSDEFMLADSEKKGLRYSGFALLAALVCVILLSTGPLAPYENDMGKVVTPYLDNVILLISFLFASAGIAYGVTVGKFTKTQDIIDAMTKQMNSLGYILVLSFFSHNFLAILSYSNLGVYTTYLGAELLVGLGMQDTPVLLLVGFIIITAVVNLLVGGLTSKWMLLGPVFIPMLYQVNHSMTPDLVSAAYRIADSSTNIITPMMTYAGVILMFMRKYKPDMTLGNMIGMMLPYSVVFLVCWTILLLVFFSFAIPLGF